MRGDFPTGWARTSEVTRNQACWEMRNGRQREPGRQGSARGAGGREEIIMNERCVC